MGCCGVWASCPSSLRPAAEEGQVTNLMLLVTCVVAGLAGGIALRFTGAIGGAITAGLVFGALLIAAHLSARPPAPAHHPPSPPPSWADAGRALSAYGAKHREVHAILRGRAAEGGPHRRPD